MLVVLAIAIYLLAGHYILLHYHNEAAKLSMQELNELFGGIIDDDLGGR